MSKRHWRATRIGLTSASLTTLLLLSGCSTQPLQNNVVAGPSDAYTEPTPVPEVYASGPAVTNADLIQALLARKAAIESCNLDKASIRSFYTQPTK